MKSVTFFPPIISHGTGVIVPEIDAVETFRRSRGRPRKTDIESWRRLVSSNLSTRNVWMLSPP